MGGTDGVPISDARNVAGKCRRSRSESHSFIDQRQKQTRKGGVRRDREKNRIHFLLFRRHRRRRPQRLGRREKRERRNGPRPDFPIDGQLLRNQGPPNLHRKAGKKRREKERIRPAATRYQADHRHGHRRQGKPAGGCERDREGDDDRSVVQHRRYVRDRHPAPCVARLQLHRLSEPGDHARGREHLQHRPRRGQPGSASRRRRASSARSSRSRPPT